MRNIRYYVAAFAVLSLSLPLYGEQIREQGRRGDGIHGRLTDEGRTILRTHREKQREQMQSQMQERREAQQGLRAALRKESDPYKQLDLLETHVRGRQQAIRQQQEQNQQARLSAYREALRVSGADEAGQEEALARMQQRQSMQRDAGPAHGDELLAKIAALRSRDDLTREKVRELASAQTMGGQRERGGARREGQEPVQQQERSRRRQGNEKTSVAE